MIDPQCARLLENAQGILAQVLASESDPVAIGRKYTTALMEAFLGARANGVETRDLRIPSGSAEIPARFYRHGKTPADSGRKLVLFFHGGGWSVGDVDSYDGFVRRLCAETGGRLSLGRFPAGA